jgi:hypothetical protein
MAHLWIARHTSVTPFQAETETVATGDAGTSVSLLELRNASVTVSDTGRGEARRGLKDCLEPD